jgi:putative thioredoxin
VRRWLERAIPSPHVSALASAREQLSSGDFDGAESAVRELLAAAPTDRDARLLFAEILLHRDPDEAGVLATALENEMDDPDRPAAVKTLARVASLTNHPERLPEGPARPRLIDAARAIRGGAYDEAMEAIIDVLREDRRYADGIARETGRAIFILLGLEHPVTARFHRPFASLLHV